jgi:hypothetical protein
LALETSSLPFVPSWQFWQVALSSFCWIDGAILLSAAPAKLLAKQIVAVTTQTAILENRPVFVFRKANDISVLSRTGKPRSNAMIASGGETHS